MGAALAGVAVGAILGFGFSQLAYRWQRADERRDARRKSLEQARQVLVLAYQQLAHGPHGSAHIDATFGPRTASTMAELLVRAELIPPTEAVELATRVRQALLSGQTHQEIAEINALTATVAEELTALDTHRSLFQMIRGVH